MVYPADQQKEGRGVKRNHDNSQPFLLPVSGLDLGMLADALISHAVESDELGDSVSASRAYGIARRAREMQGLDLETSRQAIAALGIGFSRGRPQG